MNQPAPTTRYRWTLHGRAHCPACKRLAGEVRSQQEWEMSVTPGFHPDCDCTLEPVEQAGTSAALPSLCLPATLTSITGCLTGYPAQPTPY
jgi:hypothetical protein